MFIPSLLFFYGVFLICCGITAVTLIGFKAKTALVSGGLSGITAITIGHFISQGSTLAQPAGVLICLALFIVFCWRSAKTLFVLLELVPERHPNMKRKAIAFLIISLMAVVSIVVLLLQLSMYISNRQ